jgi:hypothetical protein
VDLVFRLLLRDVVEKDEPEDELAGEELLMMAKDITLEGIVEFAVSVCVIFSAVRVAFMVEAFEDCVYWMHGVR